jgi:hypothetical protein
MDEYRATLDYLEVNGQQMTDFRSVTPDGVKYRKTVNLMGKTGKASITKRYGFTIEYVVPAGKPRFNWEALDNMSIVWVYPDGKRDVYLGCSALEVDGGKIDGETEQVINVKIAADSMRPE